MSNMCAPDTLRIRVSKFIWYSLAAKSIRVNVAPSGTFIDDIRQSERTGVLCVDLSTSGVARLPAFGWPTFCVTERIFESFSAVDRGLLACQLHDPRQGGHLSCATWHEREISRFIWGLRIGTRPVIISICCINCRQGLGRANWSRCCYLGRCGLYRLLRGSFPLFWGGSMSAGAGKSC